MNQAGTRESKLFGRSVAVFDEHPHMGTEESVFPAFVWTSEGEFGKFFTHLDNPCTPVDMARVKPFLGPAQLGRSCLLNKDVLLFRHQLPAAARERVQLDTEYAFFEERSTAPLETGYINRCRFLSVERIRGCYDDGSQRSGSLRHECAVSEVMHAFVEREVEREIGYCMGFDDLEGRYPRRDLADGYRIGFGFWIEEPGVYRLWSRALWAPK